MHNDIDIDTARYALHAIPNNLPREYWHRVGRAGIAAGLTVDDIVCWSAGASNFKSEQDVRAAFRTITPEGGTGPGTLFMIAAEYGWIPREPEPKSAAPQQQARQRATRAQEAPRKPALGTSPAEVWARSEAADNSHPCIMGKRAAGVPLDTLRVLPAGDDLRIQGESMAGALVVPCNRADGTISSLQFIALPAVADRLKARDKPGKLNLPGASMDGWFTVGSIEPGGVVHICEGVATAWACWQATEQAAVCTFGAGRIAKVTAELRQRDPSARLVLVPDVGKEPDATKIALEHGCLVVAMPAGEANNFDASDLALRDGLDALELLLEGARERTKPEPPEPLLKPVSVGDVLTHPSPPPEFVWDGLLPRGVASLLGAHGGVGKSTIALMLAVCAALGRLLFGIGTVPCNILFVSLEDGEHIVRHRLAAICKTWGIDPAMLDAKLHIVDGTEHPELYSADKRSAGAATATYSELCTLVKATGAGLVVLDNASDAFGGDEINRRQVREFMRSLAQVARLTNCAVLLLAHVDKNTSRNHKAEGGEGYSGSTAWHNSARSRMFMTRKEDGTLTLEQQKSNFGKCRDPITLEWLDGGLPQVVGDDGADPGTAFGQRVQGRADDTAAAAILKMIAEFEGRGQYCSTASNSPNRVFAMLRTEPSFQALKLRDGDTKRIVTQCQRAGWIEMLEYRTVSRHKKDRWTLTNGGRLFAGLPAAPSAPSAPSGEDGAPAKMAQEGAPSAPSRVGGVGGCARAEDGAEQGSLSNAEPMATGTTEQDMGAVLEQGAAA